ncbi:hypothetical protein BaRGS_00032726, partial [Batillaria attramentaria]
VAKHCRWESQRCVLLQQAVVTDCSAEVLRQVAPSFSAVRPVTVTLSITD